MPWIEVPDFRPQRSAQAKAQDSNRWYAIKNAASADEAELLLYDEIGGWWGSTAEEFVADLRQVTAPNLRVRVNSPGGSVTDGLAIANALRAHPANVIVQVDGIAASIASVIAIAGNRLVMMPQSMLMVHEASGLCIGDAAEMQKMADVLGLISDNIASAYAAKAGGTAADWRSVMLAETWYLAEDAVAAGLADEAVTAASEPADDDPAMHARWDLAAYGYQGPKQPEKPKPGPPPAARTESEQPPTMVISISDLLDEQTVAALRAAVRERGVGDAAAEFGGTVAPATVSAEPVGTGRDETAAGPAAPSVAVEPAAPTAPGDGWDAVIARITTPEPDPWAAAFAHLTQTPASSATDA